MVVRRRGGRRSRRSLLFPQPFKRVNVDMYREPLLVFRSLFEQAPLGMFYVSLEGYFICTNPRFGELIGYTCEELQGKPCFSVMCVEDRPKLRTCMSSLNPKTSPLSVAQTCEVGWICKDGSTIQMKLKILLCTSPDREREPGRPCYYMVYCEEASAHPRSECLDEAGTCLMHQELSDVLRERQQMDDFLAHVVHELKSPLAIVKGNIQLIEKRLQRAAQQDGVSDDRYEAEVSLLQVVDRQVERTNLLMSNLLDVSRIRIGKLRLRFIPCDLMEIIHRAITAYCYTVPECEVHLDRPAQSSVLIYADALRIEQVIGHYLGNAVKYATVKQPVDVLVQIVDQQVRVCIRDYGPGIPVEQQESIWHCFYRAEEVYETGINSPGLGVGLYISQSIIQYHHGRVGVWSVPGHGSTFWFMLPLGDPQGSEVNMKDEDNVFDT